jgi:hypothetical protein
VERRLTLRILCPQLFNLTNVSDMATDRWFLGYLSLSITSNWERPFLPHRQPERGVVFISNKGIIAYLTQKFQRHIVNPECLTSWPEGRQAILRVAKHARWR